MSKIGIAIIHCLTKEGNTAGWNNMFKTGFGDYENILDETGKMYRYIEPVEGQLVRMIKIMSGGWFLCSMKPARKRDEEYRASWVYFPVGLEIEPQKIINLVEEVETQIQSNDFDKSFLQGIAETYSEVSVDAPKYAVPAEQEGYAIRYVGENNATLLDVIGKIYQKEFAEYEWVILAGRSDVKVKDGAFLPDLTSNPLRNSFIINPPEESFHGFKPYRNGKPFVEPIRIVENEKIDVVWKRPGYVDIKKSAYNASGLRVLDTDVKKIITMSQIKVASNEGEIIPFQNIKLSHAQEDNEQQLWIVKYSDLTNAKFSVTASGYESEPINTINLRNIEHDQTITIKLKEEKHTYKFIVCLDKKKKIYTHELIYTTRGRLSDVPFPGFILDAGTKPKEEGVNILFVDDKKRRSSQGVNKKLGCIAGILLLLLLVLVLLGLFDVINME